MTDTANRIMWPFEPNWRDPYTVSYEFKTDIFTSDDGSEQRRSLRSTPRKSLSFTALAYRDKLRTFNRLVDTSQRLKMIMPEVTRGVRTAASIADGVNAVTLEDVPPPWFTPGLEVVIANPAAGYQLAVVQTIIGSSVLFAVAPGALAAGTLIHPALTGRLTERIQTKRATNILADLTVDFEVEPCSEPVGFGLPSSMFEDLEWLQADHNWVEAMDVDHAWPIGLIDFGRGRIRTFQRVNFPTSKRTYQILTRSAESLVGLFCRMGGQRDVFVTSSLEQDMLPAADLSGNSITVQGRQISDTYTDDPVRGIIEIYAPGYGIFARRISAFGVSSGNSVLTLSGDPLPTIPASAVARISWLTYSRFASDTLEITFVTTKAAKFPLNIKTLPLGTLETDANLRATLAGDFRVTGDGDNRVIYL